MAVLRLDLAYDGTGFHGYAAQPGLRTVQGELEAALATLAGGPVRTSVAGRTDAGVHAVGQVVSFEADLEPDGVHRSLDRMLPEDIAVWRCVRAPDGFDARFSALARAYRYRILNRAVRDPFRRTTTWHVPHALDLEAMGRAAGAFVGEHDFASLCRRAEGRHTVRRVLAAAWEEEGDELRFRVSARAFCHQMVRSMVALCVEVGRGRLAADAIGAILEARDRNAARGAAPPHGLFLWEVAYPAGSSG